MLSGSLVWEEVLLLETDGFEFSYLEWLNVTGGILCHVGFPYVDPEYRFAMLKVLIINGSLFRGGCL